MIILVCLALLIGQTNTLQDKHVVHLQPHHENIDVGYGGQLVELINAPTIIRLPALPPKQDSQGNPWSVDVKNLGPSQVTVIGKSEFSVRVNVNQSVHISSNGVAYFLKR
jgi:hypothetical protein